MTDVTQPTAPRRRGRPPRIPQAEQAEPQFAQQPSISRAPLHISSTDEREPQHEPVHAEARRTRRRKATVNEDMFYIPIDEIPEGSSYEWKRHSVQGMEDPFYLAGMREQGWEPVNPKRHPNWVPPGYNLPHIIKGGLILMERPMELTNEFRAEQRALAKTQQREAEQRLGMTPKGELTREHSGVEPRIVKEYMRPLRIEE